MEEHDVVEGVLVVALEVLTTVVEVGPGLEDEVFDLVVILVVVLLQFSLDLRVDELAIEVETRVMLDLLQLALQEGKFLLIR